MVFSLQPTETDGGSSWGKSSSEQIEVFAADLLVFNYTQVSKCRLCSKRLSSHRHDDDLITKCFASLLSRFFIDTYNTYSEEFI